jgi:hypothetical protein
MNFTDVSKETQKLFTNLIDDANLERVINIKLLSCNELKQIGKVVKANDLLKFMTDNDVIILINEVIFDQLEGDQKELVAQELIAYVSYDFEKAKLVITQPDVNTFSLVLKKVGSDKYLRIQEIIRLAFEQLKEKEADKAAAEKNPKK